MQGILIPFLAAAAILLVFVGLARVAGGRSRDVAARLQDYAAREVVEDLAPAGGGRGSRIADTLNTALGRGRLTTDIAARLARADIRMRPTEFMLLTLGATLLAFLFMLIVKRDLFLSIVAGLGGYYAPHLWVKRRQSKRARSFSNQLGDTITLLANSLRSGYSLLQAMDTVARELSPPMSSEFGRVVKEIGLGLSVEQAMNNMYRRIPSEDLDLMITAVNVQHEVGGNLAEILDTIGHTIRERIRIHGEIRVLTAQQRGTGVIVGSLPFVVALILYFINRNYMLSMFRDPCGWIMLVLVVILIGCGALVIRKIVSIEV